MRSILTALDRRIRGHPVYASEEQWEERMKDPSPPTCAEAKELDPDKSHPHLCINALRKGKEVLCSANTYCPGCEVPGDPQKMIRKMFKRRCVWISTNSSHEE